MKIHFAEKLADFGQKHPNSKPGLERWLVLTKQANFGSIVEVRDMFPHADLVKKAVPTSPGEPARKMTYTVFNIGGNKARLITTIRYEVQRLRVHYVFTHAEYEKWLRRN